MPSLLNVAPEEPDFMEAKEDGLLMKEGENSGTTPNSDLVMIGGVIANSRQNAICELCTAAAVGAIFISKVLPTGMFICGLAGGLCAYVVSLHMAGVLVSNLRAQGVQKPDFASKSFWQPAAFGVLGAFVLAVVGFVARGSPPSLSRNLLICICIYPLYGWAQQWLVQGLITRNLATLMLQQVPNGSARWRRQILVAIISGAGFSLVHYPDKATISAVACIGVAFASFFLRDGEVFPLGLWHGWLGSLFYYWALGEDPLGEILAGK